MRVRGRAAGLWIAVLCLAGATTGCGRDESAFCRAVRTNRSGFEPGAERPADHERQIATLDAMIRQLPNGDARRDLVAARDYATVLFGIRRSPSDVDRDQDAARIVTEFFGGASARIDRRLRNECRIETGDPAKPFALQSSK